jgi:hypothetical protein
MVCYSTTPSCFDFHSRTIIFFEYSLNFVVLDDLERNHMTIPIVRRSAGVSAIFGPGTRIPTAVDEVRPLPGERCAVFCTTSLLDCVLVDVILESHISFRC